MIKLKENSQLVRFLECHAFGLGRFRHIGSNLCSLFWKTVIATLFTIGIYGLVAWVLVAGVIPLALWPWFGSPEFALNGPYEIFFGPPIMFAALSGAAAVLVGVIVMVVVVINTLIGFFGPKNFGETAIAQAYDGWKKKYCPTVRLVVDRGPKPPWWKI